MLTSLRLALSCLFVALALALALALAPAPARAQDSEPLTVFAAASLKTALDEVAGLWRNETGGEIVVSYAGSSALARQIEQGAPADVFISASPDWMDRLEAAGLIAPGKPRRSAHQRLVLIAHGRDAAPVALSPALDLAGLLGDGRLAMALVDAVPAGIYGKAALETLGLWESVAPNGRTGRQRARRAGARRARGGALRDRLCHRRRPRTGCRDVGRFPPTAIRRSSIRRPDRAGRQSAGRPSSPSCSGPAAGGFERHGLRRAP
jgi:molybdenum ABC transporter molybdate-binding protein